MKKYSTKLDGFFYEYYKIGCGKQMFLVPAFHSDIDRFRSVIEYLSQFFTLYIPELPGISISRPFPSGTHTVDSYARYLNKLVRHLKLRQYVLAGLCLGATISVRMVDLGVPRPSAAVLFETLYHGNYFRLKGPPSLAQKLILRFGSGSMGLYRCIDFLLHNKRFLRFYLRHHFRGEKDLDTVIDHQITLTDTMNTRATLEILEDLFTLDLGKTPSRLPIPALLVYNELDTIIDMQATVEEMRKKFRSPRVVFVQMRLHAPAGPINEEQAQAVIAPVEPWLQKLSRK